MKLPRLPAAKSVLDAKYTKEQMIEYALKAMAQEREECAKVCEAYENDMGYGQPQKCADAIRARGQA